MIARIGDYPTSEIVNAIILMSKDQNMSHEYNENGLGTWLHDSGWSAAWLSNNEWRRMSSVNKLYLDNLENIHAVSSPILSLHARKATYGDVSEENLHHFVNEKDGVTWTFCHNGHVHDIYQVNAKVRGSTDSERLFHRILEHSGSVKESFVTVLKSLKEYRGVNTLLHSPTETFVSVLFKEKPEYYGLSIGRSDKAIIISSEPVNLQNVLWERVPNRSIIHIDHNTLGVTVESF